MSEVEEDILRDNLAMAIDRIKELERKNDDWCIGYTELKDEIKALREDNRKLNIGVLSLKVSTEHASTLARLAVSDEIKALRDALRTCRAMSCSDDAEWPMVAEVVDKVLGEVRHPDCWCEVPHEMGCPALKKDEAKNE